MLPHYPKISIITPSYNQAQFLERTIQSVLDQKYPNLEYIIIDGGSTDGSVNIIRKFANSLAYWVSEPDRGQSHAINKGIRIATGEWVGWQNSDDIYYQGVFESFAKETLKKTGIDLIIGNINLIDKHDQIIRDIKYVHPTYRSILAEGMVLTNQAAFWKRNVHEEIGFLNESLDCRFDYEWFLRLLSKGRASHVNMIWGALRLHECTKTSNRQSVFDDENQRVLYGREVSVLTRRIYQIRRLAIMLLMREFKYVFRGGLMRMRAFSGIESFARKM